LREDAVLESAFEGLEEALVLGAFLGGGDSVSVALREEERARFAAAAAAAARVGRAMR
jgi:hypothetical protein